MTEFKRAEKQRAEANRAETSTAETNRVEFIFIKVVQKICGKNFGGDNIFWGSKILG